MGQILTGGAALKCSFGTAPGTFNPSSQFKVKTGQPVGTIQDNIPGTNVTPFGMCTSLANPAVAAATAAAMGVLTPQPCTAMLPAPWVGGSPKVKIGNVPCLTTDCKLTCAYGGMIEIISPGQFKVKTR